MSKIRINADGTREVLEETASSSTSAAPVKTEKLSPAKARLLRLARRGEQSRIEVAHVAGDETPWFILRINFAEMTRLSLLTPRDSEGRLDMLQPDSLSALTAAMLFCCVVSGEDDETPLFDSLLESYEWALSTDEGIKQVVGALFHEISRINPDILNSGGDADEANEQPKAQKKSAAMTKKRQKADSTPQPSK